MNSTRNSDNTISTPPLQPNQQRILASLLTEGARLRTNRTRRRILTGTGIAASVLALTWAALLTYSNAPTAPRTAPGAATPPELATNTIPGAIAGTSSGASLVTNSSHATSAKPNATTIASTTNPQSSPAGSVKPTTAFTAVWRTAHNQPGGFKTITTDELLTQINTNGKSFGLIELPGTMLIVSNNRSALNAQ